MKAMILAAGLGTRLKPLTDKLPKALVPYKGKPLITYQIERLKAVGADHIVINTHYLSDKMEEYFAGNNFNVKIDLIKEDTILGTGGGILNAVEFFRDENSFLVINSDVDTDFEIKELIEFHNTNQPLAFLAVQKRKSKRLLEFNNDMLFKRRADTESKDENNYAFNGIHIISSSIFRKNLKQGYSDIIDLYVNLAKAGEKIYGYDTGDAYFKDLGKIEDFK